MWRKSSGSDSRTSAAVYASSAQKLCASIVAKRSSAARPTRPSSSGSARTAATIRVARRSRAGAASAAPLVIDPETPTVLRHTLGVDGGALEVDVVIVSYNSRGRL